MSLKWKFLLLGSGLATLIGLGACLKAGDGVGLNRDGKEDPCFADQTSKACSTFICADPKNSKLPKCVVDPCIAQPNSKACTTFTCAKTPTAPMCAVIPVDSCTLPNKPARCSTVVAKTSFKTVVWPIILTNCLPCHSTSGAGFITGKLDLTEPLAYANLVGVPVSFQNLPIGAPGWMRVVAGKPDSSMLMKKLTTELGMPVKYDDANPSRSYGFGMPFQKPQLLQPDIDSIQKWIKDGAQP